MKECIACAEDIQSKAVLCRFCGTNQPLYTEDALSKKTKQKSWGASVCPICHSKDSVQKVASVIDGGQSTSLGVHTLSTFGRAGQSAAGISLGKNSSTLATSLSLPEPVIGIRVRWIVLSALVIPIMVNQALWSESASWIGFGITFAISIAPAVLTGLVIALIDRAFIVSSPRVKTLRAKHRLNVIALRDSSYCFRDNVVFDGTYCGTPESFKAHLKSRN